MKRDTSDPVQHAYFGLVIARLLFVITIALVVYVTLVHGNASVTLRDSSSIFALFGVLVLTIIQKQDARYQYDRERSRIQWVAVRRHWEERRS